MGAKLHLQRRWLLCFLTLIVGSFHALSQESTGIVTGIVRSETGGALASVSVIAENILTKQTAGTQTDINGVFKFSGLSVKGNYKFTFTSVGFDPQTLGEYTIKSGQTITVLVKLSSSTSQLNQVVVTGYTTQRKKDLTGAVTVVNVSDAKSTPVASIDQALQGRVAGVNVLDSRQPGGGVAVRIRGFGTINNNDPLYIVDGIPITGNINNINADDIESIQVLKDASSASIYGARAANGVVIITTRTAKAGKTQLIYDAYFGLQKAMNLPALLDANEYGQLWFTALKNAGQLPPAGNPYGTGSIAVIPDYLDASKSTAAGNTNWFKEITQPGLVQSHTINFLNGGDKGSTAFNVGYFQQDGLLKYSSGFKRYSARFNSDYTFFKRLRVGEFASIANTFSQNVSENSALGSAITSVYFADPLVPVYDVNGNYAGPPANMPIGGRNPLSSLNSNTNNYAKSWRVLGKAFAELAISKGLKAVTSFALDYTSYNSKAFNPTYSEGTQTNTVNSVSFYNSYTLNTTWTNTINYKKVIGKNNLEVLAGSEFIHGISENIGAARSALPSNDINIQQLNAGTISPTNSGTGVESALFSLFGKINYSYNNTYLASFTLRNDASSKLPFQNNNQTFPAFSLGWRLSDEKFFERLHTSIPELKIRVGWGQTGNQEIADYSYFSTYAPNLTIDNNYYDITGSNTSAVTGYSQNRIGNSLLKWETSTQTNVGLDVAALNNHLTFTIDLFDKRTRDLLVQPNLPGTFGAATPPYINGGSMQNRGIELEAGYNTSTRHVLTYSINGNISYIKNKLTDLTSDIAFIPSPVSNTLTRNLELQRSVVGQPIASFFGYKMIGIFQNQQQVDSYVDQPGKAVGHFIYQDIDENGVINDKDRTFLGSPIPTINYGLNLKASYKSFDAWAFLQGASGNKIFDFTREYSDFFSSASASNKDVRILNAWSASNPTNSGPPLLTTSNTSNDTRPSSYFIQDGSYARLKTFQLGYTFSKGIFRDKTSNSLRLYIQGQNLFTVTKYQGMDPEIGLQDYGNSNRNLDIGVDRGLYPAYRTFLIGINAKF